MCRSSGLPTLCLYIHCSRSLPLTDCMQNAFIVAFIVVPHFLGFSRSTHWLGYMYVSEEWLGDSYETKSPERWNRDTSHIKNPDAQKFARPRLRSYQRRRRSQAHNLSQHCTCYKEYIPCSRSSAASCLGPSSYLTPRAIHTLWRTPV